MERRIEKNYATRALGFPVVIKEVTLRKFRDDWVAEIDWEALMHTALWALAHKPFPLTGNEVRFVRSYMEKSLKDFAALCEVKSHQAVMNWESKEDEFTGMQRATEILLRARILDVVPQHVWDHFESKRKKPKSAVSKVLADVSKFEKKSPTPLSLRAEGSDSERLEFAYA